MAINVTFLADMAHFLRGAEEGGVALEDIIDTLDEVMTAAREAGESGESVGDGLDDAARTGGRALDRLEDDIDDASRAAERAMRDTETQASRTGDNVADDLGEGFEKAGDRAGTMREDAIGSIGDIVTEAASGGDNIGESLASGFEAATAVIPGIGGAVGAVIGGIATSAFQAWAESAEATENRTRDMYQDMIDSGQNYLSYKYLEAEVTRVWEEDADKLIERAETLGVDANLLAAALAGQSDALESVSRIANDQLTEVIGKVAALRAADEPLLNLASDQDNLQAVVDELNRVETATDNAAVRAEGLRGTLSLMTELDPTLTIDANTDDAQAKIDAVAEDRTATVEAVPEANAAASSLDNLAAQQRTARINVEADPARFNGVMAGILADRTVTIRTRLLDERGVEVR